LPEVPLLGVLPGTGGLTRLTDKRKLRRDRADAFCTTEEGQRGQRALDWRLVDELVPPSAWEEKVRERALALAAHPHPNPPPLAGEGADSAARLNPPPHAGEGRVGVHLPPLDRTLTEDGIEYRHVRVGFDRARRLANITIFGPTRLPVASGINEAGADFWPLAMARELDDAMLHLRLNEPELGIIVFRSQGDPDAVLQADFLLYSEDNDWFVREVRLLLRRVLKRIDVTSRSLFALIEPGSCFAGTLAELVFAADRSLMFAGGQTSLSVYPLNFFAYPMGNGMTRLENRFYVEHGIFGESKDHKWVREEPNYRFDADRAQEFGLVTAVYDEVDWDEEVRLLLEERASFSPDALTGLEANLRFAGPETMETKIFGRLSAWQNWIFQRPGAAGDEGALKRYGTGRRPDFDPKRV
jgi:benzoyl-CoA-dihydrodiol lyase